MLSYLIEIAATIARLLLKRKLFLYVVKEKFNFTLAKLDFKENLMPYAFVLLIIANCFMTLAWYGHLKYLQAAPLWQVILISWGIAFFEYLFMIPATRMLSHQGWAMGQMKITQEVFTLLVFVPFMIYMFKQPFKLDYLWAGLCLLGCVYFVFRSQ